MKNHSLLALSAILSLAVAGPTNIIARRNAHLIARQSSCSHTVVAQSGDTCDSVAAANSCSLSGFMSLNPSINAECTNLMAGSSYCVAAGSGSSAPATTAAASAPANTGSSSSSGAAGSNAYTTYTGDGSEAQGWPSQDSWVSFDQMWEDNLPTMQSSCSQWGVADDSSSETDYMKQAIQQVSSSSGVDPRFILAIIMQESSGCVRVITTQWSFANPGLMQSNQGSGSCNRNGDVQTPCPDSEILQMIEDGTTGTATGDGLQQCISASGASDVSKYYKAARIYNGGVAGWVQSNLDAGCCTLCYASDVANRLTGWSSGASGCNMGVA